MTLGDVAEVSAAVASTSSRLRKIALLARLLTRATPDEVEIVVPFLSGSVRQRLGVGPAARSALRSLEAAPAATLSVGDVDREFARIAAAAGAGSTDTRAALLAALFRRATRTEQDFLARLISGELRQGALEGVLVDAVARAAGIPAARVRRAAMLAGSLASVARIALAEGDRALDRVIVQPLQPLQPMLADSADDVESALAELGGEAALEYKIDGARIQVHKTGDLVKVIAR